MRPGRSARLQEHVRAVRSYDNNVFLAQQAHVRKLGVRTLTRTAHTYSKSIFRDVSMRTELQGSPYLPLFPNPVSNFRFYDLD